MLKIVLHCLLLLQAATPSQSSGSISGMLRTTDGTPLENVRVTTGAAENGTTSGSDLRSTLTRTDSSGHFLLQGVPPGSYYIAAGLISYPTYYPGTASLKNAVKIDVRAGAVIENINFSVDHPRGLRVTGKLVDENGGPVKSVVPAISLQLPGLLEKLPIRPGNTLKVSLTADPSSNPQTAEIDSNGKFELEGLSPGNYKLWVNGAAGMFPQDVLIGDSDVSGVVLVMPKIVHLEGRIGIESNSSHPMPGIHFTSVQTIHEFMTISGGSIIPSLMSAQNGITTAVASGAYAYATFVRADPDGMFQVSLPAGQYTLSLDNSQGLSIRSIASGELIADPMDLTLDSDGTLHISVSESKPPAK
jgi:hypothetical protein